MIDNFAAPRTRESFLYQFLMLFVRSVMPQQSLYRTKKKTELVGCKWMLQFFHNWKCTWRWLHAKLRLMFCSFIIRFFFEVETWGRKIGLIWFFDSWRQQHRAHCGTNWEARIAATKQTIHPRYTPSVDSYTVPSSRVTLFFDVTRSAHECTMQRYYAPL